MVVPRKYDHFQVLCISMFNKDVALLDECVAALKKEGFRRANRSQLIRFALKNVDLSEFTGKE